MPNMPDKPDTWILVFAWLSQHAPTIYAGALSFVVGVLRIIYGGGSTRQALLEASLCTLITLGLIPLLEYFGLPQNLATAAGVFVGFLGVKKIAAIADRVAERVADIKLPGRKAE
ncbi:phage holin, lambda family [Pseudomonas gingeri]|uniref:phage holin, lambda family n=1 Tax=Pseudomonas gingeri TaxID=117681 RepID=UPI0015A1E31E|nr:phage holin, lambda family [Pseudomonas gingeri]NWA25497.1 phage holin, lambda family [Pseudomonas gingeri]